MTNFLLGMSEGQFGYEEIIGAAKACFRVSASLDEVKSQFERVIEGESMKIKTAAGIREPCIICENKGCNEVLLPCEHLVACPSCRGRLRPQTTP